MNTIPKTIIFGAGPLGLSVMDALVERGYTCIKDFGRALVTLSENDTAFGKAWHVPNAETLTTREFLNLAYEIAWQKPKISSIGKLMLQIGGLFIPEAKEMVEIWYEFNEPYVVDHSPFAKAFGAHPTPHRDALRETLDWFRQVVQG